MFSLYHLQIEFTWRLLLVSECAVVSSVHYCYLTCEIVYSNGYYSTLAINWSL